jgi:hypothetical protein
MYIAPLKNGGCTFEACTTVPESTQVNDMFYLVHFILLQPEPLKIVP